MTVDRERVKRAIALLSETERGHRHVFISGDGHSEKIAALLFAATYEPVTEEG